MFCVSRFVNFLLMQKEKPNFTRRGISPGYNNHSRAYYIDHLCSRIQGELVMICPLGEEEEVLFLRCWYWGHLSTVMNSSGLSAAE